MKQLQKDLTREQTLLRVAWQLLQKQNDSCYVLNVLEQSTVWDGVMCDGGCLMEEIGDLLFEQGVDAKFVGVDEDEL
tara:strand:- start:75 stop:305 length:231 start_codon:yes stop_codon:yes gene_type:complete